MTFVKLSVNDLLEFRFMETRMLPPVYIIVFTPRPKPGCDTATKKNLATRPAPLCGREKMDFLVPDG
jgi:hypothetical protein